MLYQYRCDSCRRLFNTEERGDAAVCPDCEGVAPRRWSFTVSTSMQPHWNTAVGRYVSNRRDMSEALKRQSDEMSVRTGIAHDYEMVDAADMADSSAHGVVEDGLEDTRRRQHNVTAP